MTVGEMHNHYPSEVFYSDEDEGFIAVARDLSGCSAFGETQLEALDALQIAISAWIEAAQAVGNPIPQPSRPRAESSYSGKVLLRMPKSLHADLASAASFEGVSLNQHIVSLLTHASAAHTVFALMTTAANRTQFIRMIGDVKIQQSAFTGTTSILPVGLNSSSDVIGLMSYVKEDRANG